MNVLPGVAEHQCRRAYDTGGVRMRLTPFGKRPFDAGFNLPGKFFALCIGHKVSHRILHLYSNTTDGLDLASTPGH